MRSLFVSYILLVAVNVCLAKSTSSATIFESASTTPCKTEGLECADCETLQYCSANLEPLFSVKCADQSRARPFCDPATRACVAAEPSNCRNKFQCPGEGMYPDLENCRKYYNCPANGEMPVHLSCKSNQIYSHSVKGCARGPCRTYNSKSGLCRGKINKLIAYANDKNLYIVCLPEAPTLLQCRKNEIFDERSVSCKFQCTQDGFFPARDVEKFYFCYKVGRTYQEILLECPTGSEFTPSELGKGACLREEVLEPTEPPKEPTEPPREPTEPPREPTEPPREPTEPPREPTEAPREPTEPPREPTEPPREPTEPPNTSDENTE